MKHFSAAVFALVVLPLFLSSCGEKGDAGLAEGMPHPEEAAVGELPKLEGEVSFTLEDGEERNRENPSTFHIPERERRENLKEGEIVKLIFDLSNDSETQAERMWVIVKKRDEAGAGYVGVLDNDPVSTSRIKAGLEVAFEPRHVIDIYDEAATDTETAEGEGAE